ncbi:MAG: glycoside hydrolase family 2, partial [Oscillospiraceae bacterium]|nr:glycoside hydrolase family 2 [Oscillospiraceae bacterium]
MNRLFTPWGETLDREHPLPEYPRPQLKRDSYVNLNGLWSYAFTDDAHRPDRFDGQIVVPFSPETILSGVERQLQPDEYLWYERAVTLPEGFVRDRVLLHFGAVDQIADVWWNGTLAAHHEGGYLPSSVDITQFLRDGENTLTVRVTDSLIDTPHAFGKQKYRRGGIWYTATSGIWQTVWLESVPENYIESLELTPDFDAKRLYWKVHARNPQGAHVVVRKDGVCIAEDWDERDDDGTGYSLIGEEDFCPWTPEAPFLYTVEVDLGSDHVESYFAMRKFSTVEYKGRKVLALNNRPYFHNGLLDQGYWSDGLYTAPSDEALIYDIETAKRLGFNMLRKHIKIEPLRWYYHCDRLGMLVWQDLPSGGSRYDPLVISAPLFTGIHLKDSHYAWFGRKNARSRTQYEADLLDTIKHLYNC